MKQEAKANATILRPPWLNLVRVVWVLVTVTSLLILIFGGAKIISSPLPDCQAAASLCGPWSLGRQDLDLARAQDLPVQTMVFVYYLNSLLPKIFFFLVGLIIFLLRSNDWMALLLSIMLTAFTTEGITDLGTLTPIVGLIYGVASSAFIILPFIFPNGRVEPPWLRRFVPFILLFAVSASLLPFFPVKVNDGLYSSLILAAYFLWFITGGYAFIYRYRYVSTPVERQQTKWVILAILGQTITFIPFGIIAAFFPPSQPSFARLAFFFYIWIPIGLVSYLFLSAGIALAILRYRLWDIDLILRRTLVYSLLTSFLGLVYYGSVTLLQSIFTAASGQVSPAALVISTLSIAALFTPLRMRIQAFIDRRFYRQKYDAEQALAQFAAAARSETDLPRLADALLEVTQGTVQPETSSLWLLKK